MVAQDWIPRPGECLLIDSGPTGKHLFVLVCKTKMARERLLYLRLYVLSKMLFALLLTMRVLFLPVSMFLYGMIHLLSIDIAGLIRLKLY